MALPQNCQALQVHVAKCMCIHEAQQNCQLCPFNDSFKTNLTLKKITEETSRSTESLKTKEHCSCSLACFPFTDMGMGGVKNGSAVSHQKASDNLALLLNTCSDGHPYIYRHWYYLTAGIHSLHLKIPYVGFRGAIKRD